MSQRIFSINEYTFSYLTHLKCLIENGAFRTTSVLARVDAWEAAIGDYIKRDEQNWFSVGRIDNRAFPLELQDLKNNINQRGKDFLNIVNQRLQSVASVGRDLVVGADNQPFFTCGVAPSPKITKEIKLMAINEDTPPPPSQPTSLLPILTTTICQGSISTINCPHQTRIHVVSAIYGRTDGTTCLAPNIGNTNCRAEVVTQVSAICGQNSTCRLYANNNDFTNPCPGIQKYLALEYSCVPISGRATVARASQDTSDSYLGSSNSDQSFGSTGLIIGTLAAWGFLVLVVIVLAVVFAKRVKMHSLHDEMRP